MMEISEVAQIFSMVVTAITPIAIAVIEVKNAKRAKSDKAYRELREQNEQLQKAEDKREREETNAKFNNITETVNKLLTDVEELREEVDIQKIERQLEQMHKLNEFNFEYIQSLSSVVLVMGDTLATSNLLTEDSKEKIQKEITFHRNKEADITRNLYKVIN